MKLKSWIRALRIWSLTAATIPVLTGSALAWRDNCFDWRIFILTMSSGWALQMAVNLLNTYGDFQSGVDLSKKRGKATCDVLIKGEFTPSAILLSAALLVVAGALLGVWAACLSSWKLLLFALPGVLGVIGYTTGTKFKYRGIGVPVVFLLMGVVMVMAAYYAHSTVLSWTAFAVSLPVSLLVAAILHGNDLRDFKSDDAVGIRTTALQLGLARGKIFFCILHVSAYIAVIVTVICGVLPLWTLLTLLVIPVSFKVCRTCMTTFRPGAELPDAQSLVAVSAQVHLLFGILLAIGLVV
ncbi:MAG: 1,4-dihydroxy-2-naphthoate octaprenyltransferase [Kiritimatiellia bacterium]